MSKANKESEPSKEDWEFNRELEIQYMVTLSKKRAESFSFNPVIREEDRVPERVLDDPLPHNPYVDFYDDLDQSELRVFCDRLAVRRKTLVFYRKKVEKANWSIEQDQKISLIDKALELIDESLENPTEGRSTLEKRIGLYKNHREKTTYQKFENRQFDSTNNPIFKPPPTKPSDSAKFI